MIEGRKFQSKNSRGTRGEIAKACMLVMKFTDVVPALSRDPYAAAYR
jgi:hypothetical protein